MFIDIGLVLWSAFTCTVFSPNFHLFHVLCCEFALMPIDCKLQENQEISVRGQRRDPVDF